MLNQEEQTQKFFDAINQEAENKTQALTQKNKELLEQGLKKAEEKAKAQADAMIERERLLGEQALNRTVSANIRKARTSLTDKRAEITNRVFEDAKNKLLAFTKSDEYEEFLKRSVQHFAELFPEGDAVIYIKSEDESFAPVIKAAFKRECSVEADASIVIGGCRCKVKGGNVTADDTLETRLENQKDWFLHNSKMTVVL